jgi:YidC/Oxa1 family membrane protein insertase
MSEQRRVFVAVVLCLAIAFLWNWFMSMNQPPPLPPSPPVAAGEATPAPGGLPPPPTLAQGAGAAPATLETRPIATPLYRGTLGNDGALHSLELLHYTEQPDPEGPVQQVSLVTAVVGDTQRQAVVRVDPGVPMQFGEGLTLSGKDERLSAQLEVKPRREQYAIDYRLVVENTSSVPQKASATVTLALTPHPSSKEGSFLAPPSDLISALCVADESLVRRKAGDLEAPEELAAAQWVGLDRQYFVLALKPTAATPARCVMRADKKTVLVDFTLGGGELAPGQRFETSFALYVGPKREQELMAVAPELKEVIDYNIWKIPLGFLARPMVFLLNVFHGMTASWGIAIALLTFLVKLLLFPVTYKSVASMRRMQLLKPELDKLKERLGDDRERMQMEQLKLFRERGVNPLGGCLPMLLQMPVWFALYRTLWTSVDLYEQEFLWLGNLTAPERFPFLSIAFGALTVLQQRLQPMTMDSQQAKIMMYVMPVMFAVFMIPLPSGLVLYIVVNSILTIVQQLVINRRLKQA